jgi:succinate dehydrogenase / fumarate reductase flavoprotein subunit
VPYTIGNFLARVAPGTHGTDHGAFGEAEVAAVGRFDKLLAVSGDKTVDSFHRELGLALWDHVGMGRNKASLEEGLAKIPEIRERFWKEVRVPGSGASFNQSLEKAGRVADFLEFAEVMAWDALERNESCGGHFREEHQTEEGEARRNDKDFAHAAVWEFEGVGNKPVRHTEPMTFEHVKLTQRSYK